MLWQRITTFSQSDRHNFHGLLSGQKHELSMKYFLKIVLQLTIFTFLLGCNKNETSTLSTTTTNVLKIKLFNTIDTSFKFDSRKTDYLLYSHKEKYPAYYKELIKRTRNIPKLDSFLLVSHSFQKGKFFYDLNKKGDKIYENDKRWVSYYLKDTTKLLNRAFKHEINAVSGFKNGKQIVIVDANNNDDFGDDKVLIFDNDFGLKNEALNSTELDSLPVMNFQYEIASYDNIFKLNRKFQIYPYPNHPFAKFYINETSMKKYALLLSVKDFWMGNFNYKNDSYETVFQGESKYDNQILAVRPDSLKDSSLGMAYNKNFTYYISDTISLSNNLYKLDSIYDDMSMLTLKKLNSNKPFFSYRIGYKIKDFKLTNFENKELQINDLLQKQFLLLDFWGTWCSPCRELTPDLVRINKDLNQKVNILGIAYKSSFEENKKYISDNNMNWHHVYSKTRKGIIRDLNVVSYPTFILLDKNRKILYRGSGKKALHDIEEIIKYSK